jgi:DNA-binding SARP family transcriptional activator
MALLEMRFLGGLTLQQDGVPLTEVKSQKGQALLCYLAVSQKQASRPYLAALFWPDMPDAQAVMNLRKVLNRLKPLTPYLLITRETVAFNQNADCWLDVTEFEEGTATATLLNLVKPLNASVPQDIFCLQKALTLYQGDFLDGFMLADAPLFEEWLLAQRARLREAALTALHHLVTHFREDERSETAVGYARQLLTIEPWHEETHR